VLDEPTVGVDAEAKAAIAESLIALKGAGLAILIVTHDFDDADRLADRAGFLFSGRLTETGAPRDLIEATFGARRRVEVVLATAPTSSQAERLRHWGARPRGETSWVAFLDLEGPDAAFLEEWRRRDSGVTEIKIRQPGLAALYEYFSERAS
jgi:ABC-2 type transport system ATP-binding protein